MKTIKEISKNTACFAQDKILRIVPFKKHHINRTYVAWLNDPIVVWYSEQRHIQHTPSKCKDYLKVQSKNGNLMLAIELKKLNNKHVGNLGITVDKINMVADLSIMIGDRKYWNSGIGTRAWKTVLNTLLHTYKFNLVTAGTMATNKPMIKLMRKSGMKVYSFLPNRFVHNGRLVGMISAFKKRKTRK